MLSFHHIWSQIHLEIEAIFYSTSGGLPVVANFSEGNSDGNNENNICGQDMVFLAKSISNPLVKVLCS